MTEYTINLIMEVTMKKILLVFSFFLLGGCSLNSNIVRDSKSNEYAIKNIKGNYWITENLRAESFINNKAIDYYSYQEDSDITTYGYLYSYNALKSESVIINNYRFPTLNEFIDLIESYETVDDFIIEFNVLPGGMYDYTLIEQWVGSVACFLTITNGLPKVVYINIDTNTYKIGNFHGDDAVSIRLIKETSEKAL